MNRWHILAAASQFQVRSQGGGWTPLDGLPGWTLKVFYDPSDAGGVTLVTTKISVLHDLSGNSKDLTQTTDADRPIYAENYWGAGLHAMQHLDTGNGLWVDGTGLLSGESQSYWAGILAETPFNGTSSQNIFTGDSGFRLGREITGGGDSNKAFMQAGATPVFGDVPPNSTPSVLHALFYGTSSVLYVDSNSTAGDPGGGGFSYSGLTIGRRGPSTPANWIRGGYTGAAMVWTISVHDDDAVNIEQCRAWLAERAGI